MQTRMIKPRTTAQQQFRYSEQLVGANSPVNYSYEYTSDGKLVVIKTQDVEPIINAIHHMPDVMDRRKIAKAARRYLATVPNIIALQWAKESGTRLYSKEWQEVVMKKLKTDEFRKLKIEYQK